MKDHKIILITGASSGFGKATAELLAADKHTLIIMARREGRLKELAKELKTDVYIAPVDVCDKQQVAVFYSQLPDKYRDIDVLVNSAGLARGIEPAQDAKLDNWDKMINTNISGLLYMTRHALDGMVPRKTGHIINIGSVAGQVPYKGGNVYGATKAFVKQFSKNLRTDTLGLGIRVTNIEPGMANTEFSLVRLGDKAQAEAVYAHMQPLTAEDVARTIVWAINQPEHVNIDDIEIMPTAQTYGGLAISRT